MVVHEGDPGAVADRLEDRQRPLAVRHRPLEVARVPGDLEEAAEGAGLPEAVADLPGQREGQLEPLGDQGPGRGGAAGWWSQTS